MGNFVVIRKILLLFVVIFASVLSITAFAEKDYYDFSYNSEEGYNTQEQVNDVLEIGLLMVSHVANNDVIIPSSLKMELYNQLIDVTKKINAVRSVMVPHETLLKHIDNELRSRLEYCYYDRKCLSDLYKFAGLDLLVVTKLKSLKTKSISDRSSATDETDLNGGVEHTCFVKLINSRDGGVLKEFVVVTEDHAQLPSLLKTRYYEELRKLGLIKIQRKKTKK